METPDDAIARANEVGAWDWEVGRRDEHEVLVAAWRGPHRRVLAIRFLRPAWDSLGEVGARFHHALIRRCTPEERAWVEHSAPDYAPGTEPPLWLTLHEAEGHRYVVAYGIEVRVDPDG